MKYISLLLVVAFVGFTFWFSKQAEDLTIDQMNKMNGMITRYMTEALVKNQPEVKDVEFSKIYTEVIESGRKMKAHFKFSYFEPNADGGFDKIYRKGSFIITSEDGDNWKAQIEKANDVKVEFLEPFDVTSGNDDSSDEEEVMEEDPGSADESEEQ